MNREMDDDGMHVDTPWPAEDEAEVARLLVAAGPRPALPARELEQIRGAVHAAWAERRSALPPPALRQQPRFAAALLAASLAVAAIGLAWWWRARPAAAPAQAATVESVQGDVRLLAAGGEPRPLLAGDVLPVGSGVVTAAAGGGRAAHAALRLAGGAGLRLDNGSEVRLSDVAAVELRRGGLYVDSNGGPASRIAVQTALGEVRDVGTQFAVRLAPDGGTLRVLVREGAIVASGGARTHTARAGEELVVDRAGRAAVRPAAAWGGEWSWVAAAGPGFTMEGRSLDKLLAWVHRETGWKVRLEDGLEREAASILLHGDIGNLPADRAVFAVLPGAGLEGELQDGTLVVRVQP